MMKYVGKVTRIGTTVGQTDKSGYNVGVTIGGKTLKIGNDQGVETDEKLDAKGKVVSKKSKGE